MRKKFKLEMEIVPSTCWHSNMRKVLTREQWDTVRRAAYREYKYHCGICGISNVKLHCHEIWEYDDKHHVQTLKGFIALCEMCHHVKHFGFAQILAREGTLDIGDVIRHFCTINSCTVADFKLYAMQMKSQFMERSEHEWSTDFGEYEYLINKSNEEE